MDASVVGGFPEYAGAGPHGVIRAFSKIGSGAFAASGIVMNFVLRMRRVGSRVCLSVLVFLQS